MYIYSDYSLLFVAALVTELPFKWAQAKSKDITENEIRDHCEKDRVFVYYKESRLCLHWTQTETFFIRAMSICEDYGGRLGVFDTDEKFKVLQARNDGSIWVGMDNRTGIFRWYNGRPLNVHMASDQFSPTKPNSGRPILLDCVHIFYLDNLLKNTWCHYKFKYVCEKPV